MKDAKAINIIKKNIDEEKNELLKVPGKLQDFMDGLIKETRSLSSINFFENWDIFINYQDLEEIEKWFNQFGIDL